MLGRLQTLGTIALVLNTTAAPPAPALRAILTNLKAPKIRFETLEDRQYMVVPMVMLTEGVHAGSMGPLYYPEEELAKTPVVWNHKPIVVYHPTINGVGVSACDPDILNNRKIGLIMQASYEKKKLLAEAWLDVERVKKVDDRILEAIQNGKMVELSTGLFSDFEQTQGVWNGESYVGVARNYRPDHLAILPDQKGACSIEDGAGLLRNAVSHGQTRELIQSALRARDGADCPYVEDVFNKFFIYYKSGKLWRQNYTATDIEASIVGAAEEVVRVVQYRTLDGTVIGNKTQEDSSMKRDEMVNKLIANSAKTGWAEDDRAFLMNVDEPRFKKIVANAEKELAPAAPSTPPTPAPAPAVTSPVAAPVANTAQPPKAPEPVTVESYIANAPPAIRDMIASGLRTHEAEKAKVIATIVANKHNRFKPEQLAAKSLDELQVIAELAQGPVPVVPTYAGLADAFGRGQPVGNNGAPAEAPMDLPVMNFGPAK